MKDIFESYKPLYADGVSLKEITTTGDILFRAGQGWLAKVIRKITFGRVNHAQIVIEGRIFETDAALGKSMYTPLPASTKKGMILIRPLFLASPQKEELPLLCEKYSHIPYDYWDIFLNIMLSPLKDEWRMKIATVLGTKRFMKCDELVMRLLYEVTLRKELKWYEGNTPQSFLNITLNNPESYQVLYWNP